MALQLTGFTDKSPERYVIDAGAIYLNLVIDNLGAFVSGDLIGATEGGNEFVVQKVLRNISVDGLKGRTKGNTVVESEDATLTVNLKELTTQNLSKVIANSSVDTSTNTVYDIITSKGTIELTDYISNVALVGRYSGGKPIIIFLYNVLSIEGLEMNLQHASEVVVPVAFGAHWDETNIANDEAPYKIYFPREVV